MSILEVRDVDKLRDWQSVSGWSVSKSYKQVAAIQGAKDTPILPIYSGVYWVTGGVKAGKTTATKLLLYSAEVFRQRVIDGIIDVKNSVMTFTEPWTRYVNVDEPRPVPSAKTPVIELFRDANEALRLARKATNSTKEELTPAMFVGWVVSVYMRSLRRLMRGRRVVVIDSLWMLIAAANELMKTGAQAGGIVPSFSAMVKALDSMAQEESCSVFCVQNTEQFKVPGLAGSASGELFPAGNSQSFSLVHRARRQNVAFLADDVAWKLLQVDRDAGNMGMTSGVDYTEEPNDVFSSVMATTMEEAANQNNDKG